MSMAYAHERFCLLNSNNYRQGPGEYDFLAGWGCVEEVRVARNGLEALSTFTEANKGKWMFGFLSYELKNEIEDLASGNEDIIRMPLLHFFVPELVVAKKEGKAWTINQVTGRKTQGVDVEEPSRPEQMEEHPINITARLSRDAYLETVSLVKSHIQRGDIYELNLCQEFYTEHASVDAIQSYLRLNKLSPAPMSAFFRLGDTFIISSSPERFVKRKGEKLWSQPMKGTAPRGANNDEDRMIAERLFRDEKERAENVMIVDLVRNDLSRVASTGSVQVDELFGIYPFSTVYQMVSTVSCALSNDIAMADIIRATFPMGSMTGAPKVRAMELIEKFESAQRGAFSGAAGYVDPSGDFDLNVMIRTLLYNKGGALSFMTGSAITAASDPTAEYDECLLKARALCESLGASIE